MFSLSNRGHRLLIIKDFVFYRRGATPLGGSMWACKNRVNDKCKATAKLEIVDGVEVVILTNGTHSHPVEDFERKNRTPRCLSSF